MSRSLARYCTLRAGGDAGRLIVATDRRALADAVAASDDWPTILGWGSNVLPSDEGVPGTVIVNRARSIRVAGSGEVAVDSGASFQDLCLAVAQRGLSGLEFAVGIPGSVGGALVSNAGAYRGEIADHLVAVEVLDRSGPRWVEPAWLELSYRDSRLRREPTEVVLLRAQFRLPKGDPGGVYARMRDFQRQRISKQPPPASAGSFFKNVTDPALAARLPDLPEFLRRLGKVPAGHLIERVGLKGARLGGAGMGARHANFLLNLGGATATELRSLTLIVKTRVRDAFGVELEEEVLPIGDWSHFRPIPDGLLAR